MKNEIKKNKKNKNIVKMLFKKKKKTKLWN